MKTLVDESLSVRVARLLAVAGHDAVHVGDVGLLGSLDAGRHESSAGRRSSARERRHGLRRASCHRRVHQPSVVLVRRSPHAVEDQVELLLRCLDAVGEELVNGAVVVLTPNRLRVRSLPIVPRNE